jgi:uncharacterized delta-60 repeat protein
MGIRKRHSLLAALAALLATLLVLPSADAAAQQQFRSGQIAHGSRTSIVVVGSAFAVARLGLDGSRDPSFGPDGVASTTFPGFREDRSVDAVVRADGKVTVAGYVTERCESRRGRACGVHAALARFTAAGRLDRSFGGDGRVVLSGPPGVVRGVASLAGGEVLLAGRTRSGLPYVARLRSDGTLAPSFGTRGLLILRQVPGGALGQGRVDRISVCPEGGEVVSFSGTGRDLRVIGLLDLTGRGKIVRSFGENGFLTELPGGVKFDEYGFGFARMRNCSLLVAATTDEYPAHMALVKLSSNGVDGIYGTAGVALGPKSYEVRFNVDLAVAPDGKAVVGAAGYQGSALARFQLGGAIDSSFGSAGLTEPLESWGSHASVAILADGGIALADSNRQLSGLIVAGYAEDGTLRFTTELPG